MPRSISTPVFREGELALLSLLAVLLSLHLVTILITLANDDRENKGEESHTASVLIYVHLQVCKSSGSIEKTIWQLSQAVVVEPPGEVETKQ